jgi:Skp family chaperone for outer membrane proteins
VTATGLLCLAGGSYLLNTTIGAPKEAAEEVQHRVGLIDIGYIFENYQKLKYLDEELKAEAKEEQAKLTALQKKGQVLVEEMKEFSEGSAEHSARESKLTKLSAEFETQNKVLGKEFQRKKAKMVHEVYLEVHDAVEKFCNHHKFTVIIRFTRTDLSSTDPAKVQQLMTQPVVYHRKRDDLTDGVLKYLNERYLATAGGETKPVSQDKPVEKPAKKASKIQPTGGTKD